MNTEKRTATGMTRAAFKREVCAWARRIGVQPAEIHLREMKTKQASCSPSGRLTFNTSLLVAPKDIRNEAIVHELIHLKVPNHGRLFKTLVNFYLQRLVKQ